MKFDTERMCRLNGKKPTARERWRAFYSVYRAVKRCGMYQEHNLIDCLRVLGFGATISMLEERDRTKGRSHVPAFLRKMLLDGERRRRIYENIPWEQFSEFVDLNKFVCRKLSNESGIEMTPEQVAEHQWSICRKIRAHAAEHGVTGLPDSDLDLLRWVKDKLGAV